jgi:hypothetical protein
MSLLVYQDSSHWYIPDSFLLPLGLRLDFDRFSFDQILLMITMRRSLASQFLARGLAVYVLSHLSSHLFQPPWREVRTALLGRLLHFFFLLLLRVIFLYEFVFSYLGASWPQLLFRVYLSFFSS